MGIFGSAILKMGILTHFAMALVLATYFIWKSRKKYYRKKFVSEDRGGVHVGPLYMPDYMAHFMKSINNEIVMLLEFIAISWPREEILWSGLPQPACYGSCDILMSAIFVVFFGQGRCDKLNKIDWFYACK